MVQSYNSLLAEGSLSISNRPQSASSRKRIDTASTSPGVKVFANSLYDAGDILAGQPELTASAVEAAPAPPSRVQLPVPQPPPMSPMSPGGSQKLQQQRALAAQKRMERLQMGGLAQNNDSIAVVTLGSSGSRPGTPKTASQGADPFNSFSPSGTTSGPQMPTPPSGGFVPGGSRSHRMRQASCNSRDAAGATGSMSAQLAAAAPAGPWQGSGPVSGGGGGSSSAQGPPSSRVQRSTFEDEDLEVETLGEPVRPGTASAQQQQPQQHQQQHRPSQGSTPGLRQPQAANVDLSNIGLFLRHGAPHASSGSVLCCIERAKVGLGKNPIYRFHLELPNGGYQFLLSARKRVKTATSSYIISTSADDVSRHSNSYIAKLRSNFVGTGFSMYLTGGASGSGSSSAASSRPMSGALGSGVGGSRNTNTQRQLVSSSTTTAGPLQAGQRSMRQQHSGGGGGGIGSSSGRRSTEEAWQAAAGGAGGGVGGAGATNKQEFGAVMYEYNVLGTRGPRKLSAAVPHVDDGGNVLWVPSGPQDSMAERLRAGGQATNHLVVLKNKEPKWNTTLNAYCLNFNGRVTEASVKNFQLVTASDPDTVVLQFGKVSDTCFTCDFCWPLSPLQAFSICLSSFDNKLGCE